MIHLRVRLFNYLITKTWFLYLPEFPFHNLYNTEIKFSYRKSNHPHPSVRCFYNVRQDLPQAHSNPRLNFLSDVQINKFLSYRGNKCKSFSISLDSSAVGDVTGARWRTTLVTICGNFIFARFYQFYFKSLNSNRLEMI